MHGTTVKNIAIWKLYRVSHSPPPSKKCGEN